MKHRNTLSMVTHETMSTEIHEIQVSIDFFYFSPQLCLRGLFGVKLNALDFYIYNTEKLAEIS